MQILPPFVLEETSITLNPLPPTLHAEPCGGIPVQFTFMPGGRSTTTSFPEKDTTFETDPGCPVSPTSHPQRQLQPSAQECAWPVNVSWWEEILLAFSPKGGWDDLSDTPWENTSKDPFPQYHCPLSFSWENMVRASKTPQIVNR